MAERIIVWSENAKFELKEIFDYFNFRNKIKVYSLKLHRIIQVDLKLLLQNPEIGKKTEALNVRGLLIENYFFFMK
ncbi:MAG: type II toxin-antitoxin system RelE/ParE family toxin [Flavobacterium sp.]|nr:type II toxin-antitoxin system RelE/ParE family toxin [Flavobacterium sp.]